MRLRMLASVIVDGRPASPGDIIEASPQTALALLSARNAEPYSAPVEQAVINAPEVADDKPTRKRRKGNSHEAES